MRSKSFRKPKKHKSTKVMWLSALYRIKYRRDRSAFYADHPEVLQMSSFDQRYILT
jgi:hypothetical protein